MAELVDERELAPVDSVEVETEQEKPQPQEDELPEKYRGKSIAEVVRMHQEAEKTVGRQSQEVGELRKVADSYIQAQLKNKEPEPEVDFFVEPEKAVRKAIESHPDIIEAKQAAQDAKKNAAITKLKSKHPEMTDIIKDSQFLEWVQSSPVRTRLLQDADANYDVDAADELFSNWKERKQISKTAADAELQSRKQSIRSASTGGTSGSADQTGRKIYRRADIIHLMQTDRPRYEAIQDEILQAYAEGRVK